MDFIVFGIIIEINALAFSGIALVRENLFISDFSLALSILGLGSCIYGLIEELSE